MNKLFASMAYASEFSLDDPRTTYFRKELIQRKSFLKFIYTEWYKSLNISPDQIVIELGSGGGFLSEIFPNVITTEVFFTPLVNIINDARFICFRPDSIDLLVLVDVFHHIPDVDKFLKSAGECLKPGGKIVMIEPWNTPWSSLVFRYLHPEPFDVHANWTIFPTGPLSGANGALPWIVFQRDYDVFCSQFPLLHIKDTNLLMPIAYLLSGGLTRYTFVPGYLYRFCRFFERFLPHKLFAMFARVELQKSFS